MSSKYRSAYIIFIFSITSILAGQSPIVPEEPLCKNQPSSSEWVVTYSSRDAAPSKKQLPKSQRIVEIKVTKSNSVRREITVWTDNLSSEKWICDSYLLWEELGRSGIYITSMKDEAAVGTSPFENYSNGDYPELGWLKPKHFARVVNFQNDTCYLFEESQSGLSSSGLPRKAWIDVKTKFPVAFDDGISLRTYLFRDNLSVSLELPARFRAALENYQKILAAHAKRPMSL